MDGLKTEGPVCVVFTKVYIIQKMSSLQHKIESDHKTIFSMIAGPKLKHWLWKPLKLLLTQLKCAKGVNIFYLLRDTNIFLITYT